MGQVDGTGGTGVRPRMAAEVGELVEHLSAAVLTESEEEPGARREVGRHEQHLAVAVDAEHAPRVERRVPQHRGGLDAGIGEEVECVVEVVLRTDADDLDLVCTVTSEPLDIGGFAPAGRSMRRPEPEKHRPVAVDRVGDRGHPARFDVEHLDESDIVARPEVVDIGFGVGCGVGPRRLTAGIVVAAGALVAGRGVVFGAARPAPVREDDDGEE